MITVQCYNAYGIMLCCLFFIFFFFNDTATTEIYTLSLHDALPIYQSIDDIRVAIRKGPRRRWRLALEQQHGTVRRIGERSEEHTSELQSRQYLVCRLLLEKKKKNKKIISMKDKYNVVHTYSK